jgi:hypothetical protein
MTIVDFSTDVEPFSVGFDPQDPVTLLGDRELGGLPRDVFAGLYVSAWARAEHCDVSIVDGHLELRCRYTPTSALDAAFARNLSRIRGVLFWGVPLLLTERQRAFAASWPSTWGACRS